MRRRRSHAIAAAAACLAALALPGTPAHADPGVLVYPGMEVIQGTNVCTLGFVDVRTRTAYTAGHCRGDGTVRDKTGTVIGTQMSFRDNTPDGATIDTNHQITDWQVIRLRPDVAVNDILPGGRVLVAGDAVEPEAGLRVCHFGVMTGESCGTIKAVYNGWFTMTDGVVSQKGDSGGPVYVPGPDNRAALVGMFNSTWGEFPAAVSWRQTSQQMEQEVISAASANVEAPAGIP